MQVVYGDASNIYLTAQKRLVRVVYGQTQATPYAAVLDPELRTAEGEIRIPKSTDTKPIKRAAEAYTFKNSLPPGLVLVKTSEEYVAISAGGKEETPFGILGQWVGGTFDNIKQSNQVSAWMGVDSVYDILEPVFVSTGLATKFKEYNEANEGGKGDKKRVMIVAATDGRLEGVAKENLSERVAVAEGISLNGPVLRIRLLV